MHRPVVRLFLAQVLLFASFAMAAPNPQAAPASACAAASSPWAGDPLMGAIFLSPPNGCSSICSASNGQSCPGPVGKIKSCYDVSYPDGCGSCVCTSSFVWSCSIPVE